jgi:hypothetical protein
MELLVTFLVFLVIVGLVWWATQQIISAYGISEQIAVPIKIVLVIIVIFLLWRFAVAGLPHGVRFF